MTDASEEQLRPKSVVAAELTYRGPVVRRGAWSVEPIGGKARRRAIQIRSEGYSKGEVVFLQEFLFESKDRPSIQTSRLVTGPRLLVHPL